MSHFVTVRQALIAARRVKDRVDPRRPAYRVPAPRPVPADLAMHVGIVGAGISGLVAANLLERAGHRVTVFEARDRVGGRIHTLDLAEDGSLPVDAGASRVPANHTHTLGWLHHLQVEVAAKYPERGRLVHLSGDDRKIGRDISALSHHSIHRAISHGDGPDLIERSAVAAAFQLANETLRRPFWYRVPGGAARLPRAVAATLKGRVLLGTPVSAISEHQDGVTVTSSAGVDSFDRVLVTVPVPLYGSIAFTPELPIAKRTCVDEAEAQPSLRAFVVTRGRGSLPDDANGWGSTDGGVEIWHFESPTDPDRTIHVLYAQGGSARTLVDLPPREREVQLLDTLERAFPGTKDHTEAVHSHCWNDDPWARGAQTVNRRHTWKDLSAPFGRVHFAGEGTSAQGWINGTISSVYRAVAEITPMNG